MEAEPKEIVEPVSSSDISEKIKAEDDEPLDYSRSDEDENSPEPVTENPEPEMKKRKLSSTDDDITSSSVSCHLLPAFIQNLQEQRQLSPFAGGIPSAAAVEAAVKGFHAQQKMSAAALLLTNKELTVGLQYINQVQRPSSPKPSQIQIPISPIGGSIPLIKTSELQKVNQESLAEYSRFRESMLRQFAANKIRLQRGSMNAGGGGSPSSNDYNSNDESREKTGEAYWERRKKNNEAAKRSRDARRAKEDEVAIRAAFLEQENVQLKWEVNKLKNETDKLKKALITFGTNAAQDSGFESA